MYLKFASFTVFILLIISKISEGTPLTEVPVYSVFELQLKGNNYTVKENPVRDIILVTTWKCENGGALISIYGFYDGDGQGGRTGNCFKVRFTPVKEGSWVLLSVQSNDQKLNRQSEGLTIKATQPRNHGFWIADKQSPGSRWYKRSDGSHQYITGNTMYSFLSEYSEKGPSGSKIQQDIINNSKFFNKIRIGITGDRYPNPASKPFLDNEGIPTDDGNYSHRPNPEWFGRRLDLAVQTAYGVDMISDLIINGPDTYESRSILTAGKNNGDNTPFLRYIAARYGSYPNVWICLSNEFDIKEPVFSCNQVIAAGKTLQDYLPYQTPVSVHGVRHWVEDLNSAVPWFDHVILQTKLKKLDEAADNIMINYILGGGFQPVIDDELAYEGAGDGWTENDVTEAVLGAFAGGGYASTGHKSGNKTGQYFSGNFNPGEHKSADNLAWLRKVIDNNITYWMMEPVSLTDINDRYKNIFRENADSRRRIMAWENEEYLIAGNSQGKATALLPEGYWRIVLYDAIAMKDTVLSNRTAGKFEFKMVSSRAQLIHFKKIE